MAASHYVGWSEEKCRQTLARLQEQQEKAVNSASSNGVAFTLNARSLADTRVQIGDLSAYMYHRGWLGEMGPYMHDTEVIDYRNRRPPVVPPCQCEDEDGDLINA